MDHHRADAPHRRIRSPAGAENRQAGARLGGRGLAAHLAPRRHRACLIEQMRKADASSSCRLWGMTGRPMTPTTNGRSGPGNRSFEARRSDGEVAPKAAIRPTVRVGYRARHRVVPASRRHDTPSALTEPVIVVEGPKRTDLSLMDDPRER